MLETVLFFTLVSIITEIILMMHLPLFIRRHRAGLALCGLVITVAVTVFNFWIGFGTVTGTLTAKLAFIGGFLAVPITRALSAPIPKLQLRMRAWLWLRGKS